MPAAHDDKSSQSLGREQSDLDGDLTAERVPDDHHLVVGQRGEHRGRHLGLQAAWTRGLDQLVEVRSDGVRGQVSADAVPHLRAERGAVQQQEALRHQPTSRSAAANASRHGRSGLSPAAADNRDENAE